MGEVVYYLHLQGGFYSPTSLKTNSADQLGCRVAKTDRQGGGVHMIENRTLDREFDFDKAIEAIKRAAAELAKPEVRDALTVIGEGASAVAAIQDAVKAVAIQDAVKAVAIQDTVKAVAIQDAVKAVAIQDAVKAVAIQDAVKAVRYKTPPKQ